MITKPIKDRTGNRFGRLTAVRIGERASWGGIRWLCKCDCGGEILVPVSSLTSGGTVSCGCRKREGSIIHGFSKRKDCRPPEYTAYHSAKRRCNNPNNDHYVDYGGRGIKFKFDNFIEFYKEVGPRPSFEYSLDRIDNDGHYEPGNVRWLTRKEQARNRRCNNCIGLHNRLEHIAFELADDGVRA